MAKKEPLIEQEVLTVSEVAKLLRISQRTVYHLVRDKKIPALKIGTKFRFSRQAVFEALEKGER